MSMWNVSRHLDTYFELSLWKYKILVDSIARFATPLLSYREWNIFETNVVVMPFLLCDCILDSVFFRNQNWSLISVPVLLLRSAHPCSRSMGLVNLKRLVLFFLLSITKKCPSRFLFSELLLLRANLRVPNKGIAKYLKHAVHLLSHHPVLLGDPQTATLVDLWRDCSRIYFEIRLLWYARINDF